MIKTLILLLLISSIVSAQDSTYIQYSTGNVEAFKPMKLVDAFDKAFGYDKDVKFRLKAGLKSYANFLNNTSKTWEVSGELKLGGQNSIKLDVYQSNRFPNLEGQYIIGNAEFRHYLKAKSAINNLSGTYLSVSKLFNFSDFEAIYGNYLSGFYLPDQNVHSMERALADVKVGQQFGGFVDYGIKLGLKKAKSNFLDEQGGLLSSDRATKFFPYLSSYSSISIGQDFPSNKKNSQSCSFFNCNEKVNHLLKVDFSGMFYIDQFRQNIQSEIIYEQKLGKWPLSISGNLDFGFQRYVTFKPTGEQVQVKGLYGQDQWVPQFEDSQIHKTIFTLNASSELRYYPLQKRQVMEGKAQEGLHGLYVGAYVKKRMFDNRFSNQDLFQWIGGYKHTTQAGPLIGFQKKIANKHFIDVGTRFQDHSTNNYSIGKVYFNPYFKFGYAF